MQVQEGAVLKPVWTWGGSWTKYEPTGGNWLGFKGCLPLLRATPSQMWIH